MADLNYEISTPFPITHTISTIPRTYNIEGTIGEADIDAQPIDSVPLRAEPFNASEVLISLSDGTPVTMLREWASGQNKWAYILYGSENVRGYVLTQHLKILESYKEFILPKAEIEIQPMSSLALALVPEKTWIAETAPYYHTENGEWWFSVTLPYTCVEEGTLSEKILEAKSTAVSQMYAYFDINPSDKIPTQNQFVNGLQSTYVKDYFLGTRPGSELMMLVVIPAVYVKYLQENTSHTIVGITSEDHCISIPANNISDLDNVQKDIVNCLVRQYQTYLNSNVEVTNFNFENEIFKQTEGISQLKFLLKQNGIDLNSIENQTASPDACVAAPTYRKIEVCFDNQYMLKAVHYYNNKGQKKILSTGLNHVKNNFPFDEKRFGYLFLNQNTICSQPELTLKTFFEEYIIDPKPDYKVVTYNTKTSKKLSPYGAKELGAYVNTALFLSSLAKQYGNVFDLNQAGAGNIGFNCHSSNKAVDAFKLKALEYRDSQFMFSGDIMAFFQWVCDLKFSDMEEAISKAGNGIGDWGWEWLIGDSDAWDVVFGITFSDLRVPSFSLVGELPPATERACKEAVDQATKKIIEYFLVIKCELLLAGVAAFGAIAAGVGIGAYYASQGKKNKLGEDVSALPSPAELAIRDYGGENCNDIIQNSLGSSNENYSEDLLQIFQRCGVFIPENQKSLPKDYLDAISLVTSPVELLSLLEGSASSSLINFVLKYTQKEFPTIYESKGAASKISSLFTCLGENTTQEVLFEVQQRVQEKANDAEFCEDLKQSLENIMKEKCPSPEVYNAIYEKEFGSKIETYQNIITLLGDDCNNVKINLFNNPETGEKGILNVLKGKTKGQEGLTQSLSNAVIGSTKATITGESLEYYSKYGEESFGEVAEKFISGDLVLYEAFEEPQTAGGTSYYHFSDGGAIYELPVLKLLPDGAEEVRNLIDVNFYETDDNPYKNPASLGQDVQLVLDNNQDYDTEQNYLNLSRHQMLFYSFISNFFKENSKDATGTPYSSPMPFGVTTDLLSDNETDVVFPAIFSTIMERYARKVGFMWQGDQEEIFASYSTVLTENIENIINYDRAANELSLYYDPTEYDDPNDITTVSPRQYAIMNSVMYAYTRVHIVEYLALTMPFYEVFDFGNSEDSFLAGYELYPELIKDVIRTRMIKDIAFNTPTKGASPLPLYMELISGTYDFIKIRANYEVKEYSGLLRGLDFYIENNFKSVYDSFSKAMQTASPKKSKSPIESGLFMYSKNIALETHNFAGLQTLFDKEYLGDQSAINGYSVLKASSTSNERYSLFKGDRYNIFKKGAFFIQNYFYIEDDQAFLDSEVETTGLGLFPTYTDTEFAKTLLPKRNEFVKGVLNLDQIKKLNKILTQAGSLVLKDTFKTIKYGSRLCFGVAYDKEDTSSNGYVKDFAVELFNNYQKLTDIDPGEYGNSNNLSPEKLASAAKTSPVQKHIVCVDGSNCLFLKNTQGEWMPNKNHSIDPDNEYIYAGTESNFSVVLPLFKFDQEVDMDQTWDQFYQTLPPIDENTIISNILEFKNLNNTLINSDQYKALVKACFTIESMIHVNALTGLVPYYFDNTFLQQSFDQTKKLFVTNIQNVMAAKNIN